MVNWRKLRNWNILITITAAVLSTAVHLSAEGPAAGDSTVVLSEIPGLVSLNPFEGDTAFDTVSARLLFDSLLERDAEGGLLPGLADSWKSENEGRVWTFALHRGVRFHDGTELTADDVVFTLNAVLDPPLPLSGLPSAATAGFSCRKLDRYTVRFEKSAPGGPGFFVLVPIVPRHSFGSGNLLDGEFTRRPVGTGSYRFIETDSARTLLMANHEYFRGEPRIESFVIRKFDDRQSAWAALMQGTLDVVPDLDQEDFLLLKNDSRFRVYRYQGNYTYSILMNYNDPLFSQPEIRDLFRRSIDREDLLHEIIDDSGRAGAGPAFIQQPVSGIGNISGYRPADAGLILDKLGWVDTDNDLIREKNGEELVVSLLLDGDDPLELKAAKRIRWQLLLTGIKLEIATAAGEHQMQEYLADTDYQTVLIQLYNGEAADGVPSSFDPGEPVLFLFCRDTLAACSRRITGVNPGRRQLLDSVLEWKIEGGRSE